MPTYPRSLLAAAVCALLAGACSGGGGGGQSSGGAEPAPGSPSTPAAGSRGDFSSVWQAASVEVTVYDSAAPTTMPEQRTIQVPAVVTALGKNVELYVTFAGDKRITYAHTENAQAYYRIAQPAFHYGEGDIAQYSMASALYTLEEGVLKLTTSRESGGKTLISITTFRPVTFPPASWPAEKIDQEAGEEYP